MQIQTPTKYQPTLSKSLLYFTITISGGAVMILELLGTRIIAPYYGVSLYVWTALISVTMVSLALGYYVGGYLADRFKRFRLAHVILIAALTTLVIPFISGYVLELTNPLGIRGGAFVSALLLFTIPLTALAMVGPFVIKLATRDITGVGRIVGSTYAVSTVGSVLGTLLLAFYLLPSFGTRAIIFSTSIVLMLLAILLSLRDKPDANNSWNTLPLVFIAVCAFAMSASSFARPNQPAKDFTVLHAEEGHYGWVRVIDDEKKGARLLVSDSSVLSAMDIAHGRSLLGYQAILGIVPRVFRPTTTQALLIGLGGGHVARDLKAKGIETDTIEIDPIVADMAKRFFNFTPTGQFIVGDARYEIKSLDKQYDFIIHDCFTGGSEPTHMLTVEMLTQLRNMLTQQGVLALNYVGYTQGEGANAVTSVYKTLATVLPNIRVFVTDKGDFTDFIFLASKGSLTLQAGTQDKATNWLLEHEYTMTDKDGIVITDDFNPMESMQVRKAESYRKIFMDRIAPELLFL